MIDNIDRVPTLPRLLAGRGYVSFQTGKWWEGDFRRGGFTAGMSLGGRHGDQGLEIGRATMQPLTDFIDRAATSGKPFFVWYAPMLPHSPHNPPERILKEYASVAPTPQIASYWANCQWFDETCGQLLDYLDAKRIARQHAGGLHHRQRLDPDRPTSQDPPPNPSSRPTKAVCARRSCFACRAASLPKCATTWPAASTWLRPC